MEILRSYTPLVEPIALDEAFLDVAGVAPHPRHRARDRAGHPRPGAGRDRGSPSRSGVATTKLLAKLASDLGQARRSPRGRTRAPSSTFLHPLPVRRLWGVGPATERTPRHARRRDRRRARRHPRGHAGAHARQLLGPSPPRARVEPRRAAGGRRPGGEVDRPRGDLPDRPPRPRRARAPARAAWPTGWRRGSGPPTPTARTVQLKVRFADFRPSPAPARSREPTDLAADIGRVARELLDALRRRAAASACSASPASSWYAGDPEARARTRARCSPIRDPGAGRGRPPTVPPGRRAGARPRWSGRWTRSGPDSVLVPWGPDGRIACQGKAPGPHRVEWS